MKYFTEGSSGVCVWVTVSQQNTGVSKANSASSPIWLKTKLRIDPELLERESRWINYFLPPLVSSCQNENCVINYSPSCRSKPIRTLFIFRTQIKMFLIKSESYLTRHRQQHNLNIPRSRNIVNTSAKQSIWLGLGIENRFRFQNRILKVRNRILVVKLKFRFLLTFQTRTATLPQRQTRVKWARKKVHQPNELR